MHKVIIWFRQDLRLDDNPALQKALEKGEAIIPLYIWAPEEEGEWAPGGATKWWLHHSLKSLDEQLQKVGLSLIIRKGKSLDVLKEVIKETGAKGVFWNRRYEPAIIKRDSLIKSILHDEKISVQSFNSALLFEPWEIKNKQGKPFQVFTPFWKNCCTHPTPQPLSYKLPSLKPARILSLKIEDLELLPRIQWDEGIKKMWTPGAMEAKQVLAQFLDEAILTYPELRDRPDLPGVSRLSPYLHFGEISPRMIYAEILKKYGTRHPETETYLRQLGWRDFAHHLLYHFPSTPAHPLRKEFLDFPWDDNLQALHAWQKGLTGYPIIDAGMRQLWTTGWMHNRVRMLVGSFLVKDLFIPWQEGAKWFWDTLVDADLANNTLGWQWVAGCGADAAPYFRIFNPVTQSEKFDPQGNYIRKWVPELAKLPEKWIHKPWETPELILRGASIELGKTYPKPIVDHASARERALEAFKNLRIP